MCVQRLLHGTEMIVTPSWQALHIPHKLLFCVICPIFISVSIYFHFEGLSVFIYLLIKMTIPVFIVFIPLMFVK